MYSEGYLVQASDQKKGNQTVLEGRCLSKLLLRLSRNRDLPTTSAGLFSHLH